MASILYNHMKEVPDPRVPYNQKHKFLDIIVIAVTAILCGMDTWNEIEDWAESKREWLGTFLELPGEIPFHDTINRVFQMMDPEKFHDAFFRWTGAVAGKIEGVVAIDGKTVRKSRDDAKGNRPIHVVSAWACEASLVLGQLKVDEKTIFLTDDSLFKLLYLIRMDINLRSDLYIKVHGI